MSEKSIADFIQGILECKKGFMKVKDLPGLMNFDMKRKLGLVNKKNISATAIRKAIEPFLEDRFIFIRKGTVIYIVVPCDPSEFVINALNGKEAVSPKVIAKELPLITLDFLSIVNELSEEGKIKIILNDKFEARIMLSDSHEDNRKESSGEYTRERFKNAFNELEKGRIYVSIPQLRKKLSWPHDVFDEMIYKLRNDETIILHVTEAGKYEPEEFFYDEDSNRMGMVTWNDK